MNIIINMLLMRRSTMFIIWITAAVIGAIISSHPAEPEPKVADTPIMTSDGTTLPNVGDALKECELCNSDYYHTGGQVRHSESEFREGPPPKSSESSEDHLKHEHK